MTTEQHKASARRFQEEFNGRNWEGCRSVLSPDCAAYQPGAPDPFNNDQLMGVGLVFASAFPFSPVLPFPLSFWNPPAALACNPQNLSGGLSLL